MNFKEKRSFSTDGRQGRVYEADNSFTDDELIKLLTQLETDRAKFFTCYCSTFTESGTTWSPELESLEELQKMKDFPNPSIQVRAVYVNRKTDNYEFDVSTAVNTNVFTIKHDDAMANYIKKQVDMRKMLEAKKKSDSQDTKGTTNTL